MTAPGPDWIAIPAIGLAATAVMDAWAWLRRKVFGVPPLDYALVGRWLGNMRHGRLVHRPISASPPVRHERALGWIAHYATGIGFAGILVVLWGPGWLAEPRLLPALIVGTGSAVAPFFLMQPCFGAGIAASRTPRPGLARLHTLVTHAVFGLGLYAGGWALNRLAAGPAVTL
jgi:hypothetical protein